MLYFKHFSNASDSIKLQMIQDRFGMEGYGRYWALFELMSEKFDGESIVIELHHKELLKKLEFRLKSSLKTFSDFLNSVELFLIILETDSTLTVSCPMLLELMDRDSKYNSKKRVVIASKIKSNSKIKNKKEIKNNIYEIDSRLSDDFLRPYLEKVKTETQEAWLKTYPDHAWLKNQLQKAVNWLISNNAKRKDIARYFNNWLSNSRPERPSIKSATTAKDYHDRVMDALGFSEASNG